ncbi:MAG: hypothetical protein J5766_05265 [Clostridia bacterium]|nr:hypothetical protein [Clostridia bacterium]
MNETNLLDVTKEFEKYFNAVPLYNYFWVSTIAKDRSTGSYYTYQPAFQAGDRSGWRYLASTFEEAVKEIESSRMR